MQKFNKDNRNGHNRMNRDSRYKNRRPRRQVSYLARGVVLQDGESAEQLIRRFKKVVEASGVMRELKRREFYLSPAQKVRDKKKRAAKKSKKRVRPMHDGPADDDDKAE